MADDTTTTNATNKPIESSTNEVEKKSSKTGLVIFIILFTWLWFIAGLLAFVASLICFGFNGSISDKFLGVLLVLILGPFYWLYFIYNSNYCFL